MQRNLKWFAVLTTIGMLFILLGGALVTKTESGMGCGRTWPLCEGQIIPDHITLELVIELSHRLVSGTVGMMVLFLSIWSWRKIGHIRETKFLSLLSITFLILQGLIGAAAVLWGQSDFVLAAHFGISLISFSSVFLLTLLIFEVDKKWEAETLIIDKRMSFHITGILLFCFFVVYTGALVRHTNASLVCPKWPICNSFLELPTTLFEWIQMGHRSAAAILFFWVAYALILTFTHYRHQKVVYWGWMAAFTLVTLQVAAGALIIISRLNLFIALSHALFIVCFFGIISYLLLLVTRNKKNSSYLEKNDPNIVTSMTSQ